MSPPLIRHSRSGAVVCSAESRNGRVNAEHREKLRQSALTDQQIEALGWSTGLNGRLQIPYLKPDGSPERCHNGKPFIRERLTAAEIEAVSKQEPISASIFRISGAGLAFTA